MALIKCEECGKEISDDARHCPYCGKPNKKSVIVAKITRKISPLQIGIISTGIIVLIFILAIAATSPPSGMTRSEYKKGVEALEILDQYLNGNLSADLAADRIDGIRLDLEKDDSIDTITVTDENGVNYQEILPEEDSDYNILASRLEYIVTLMDNPDLFGSMIQSERDELAELLEKD